MGPEGAKRSAILRRELVRYVSVQSGSGVDCHNRFGMLQWVGWRLRYDGRHVASRSHLVLLTIVMRMICENNLGEGVTPPVLLPNPLQYSVVNPSKESGRPERVNRLGPIKVRRNTRWEVKCPRI